jgi:hypothetical protein
MRRSSKEFLAFPSRSACALSNAWSCWGLAPAADVLLGVELPLRVLPLTSFPQLQPIIHLQNELTILYTAY